jgi:hypothetical protein
LDQIILTPPEFDRNPRQNWPESYPLLGQESSRVTGQRSAFL